MIEPNIDEQKPPLPATTLVSLRAALNAYQNAGTADERRVASELIETALQQREWDWTGVE